MISPFLLTCFGRGEKIKLDKNIKIDKIINQIDGYSGAHIRDLVHTSAVEALKESIEPMNTNVIIKKKHLDIALKKISIEHEKYKKIYV